jgi:hypothetical protein
VLPVAADPSKAGEPEPQPGQAEEVAQQPVKLDP